MFDRAITDKKDVINIYALSSQIYTAKNLNKYSTSKSEDKKLKLKSLKLSKLFANNWKDSLPNILQKQILPKPKHKKIFYKKNNTTANKKTTIFFNKSLPITLYKRTTTSLLTVNKFLNCYPLYLLLLIFNNILFNQKIL